MLRTTVTIAMLRCRVARALLPAALVAAALGCGRSQGDPRVASRPEAPPVTAPPASPPGEDRRSTMLDTLEAMRWQGHFEQFVEAAVTAGLELPDDPALALQECEARLAVGQCEACEAAAVRAAQSAAARGDDMRAAQGLRLWTLARMRQSKPLDDPAVAALLAQLRAHEDAAGLIAPWHDGLAGRRPFRVEASDTPLEEIEVTEAPPETIPFELAAVQARANGVTMARVFIDTGAQHTLMTVEAARAAGVTTGPGGTSLQGFAGVAAQSGVLETLELGGVVVHDVPVLVGDSAPLVANRGQISLGTELMHHVRFHIDYPAHRVAADTARTAAADAPAWTIPLWTFSQVCLAQGRLPNGVLARVLVDTGDGAGTFVSHRWGRRYLPALGTASSPLVFRFKKRNLSFESLALGSQTLARWPITDTLPAELDRLNLVDAIVGYDLLWRYRVTIDLGRRVLELRGGQVEDARAASLHAEARP